MATDLRVYDNEHGDPVVVMVTTGTFDVSRLVGLMEKGRSEDHEQADAILRGLRRHNGGMSALRVLKAHGGPDLLEPAQPDSELTRRIHRATSDPGAVTPRQSLATVNGREYESLSHWQMRAVLAAIGPYLGEPAEIKDAARRG